MSADLAFRLRQYTPGGERGGVLPWAAVKADLLHSDTGTIRIAVSETVAGSLAFPQVVALEQSTGSEWSETARFVLTDRTQDLADPARMVTLTGMEYLPWLLQRLRIRNGGEDHTREWKNGTVGGILTDLITEGQDRGWGPTVTLGFTRTLDSNGEEWPTFRRSFVERMPVMQALGKLVATGRCEWRAEGDTLHAYVPGTGRDLTGTEGAVRLGAVGSARPTHESWDGIYTTLGVSLDEGATADLVNPDAPDLFGTLEGWVEQSGVAEDEVEASTEEYLAAAAAPRREVTVTVDVGQGGALPGVDYDLGDWVLVNEGAGWVRRRAVSLTIDATPDGKATLATATGSRFRDIVYRMARAQAEANAGAATLGDGTPPAPPPPPALETRIPAAPDNFTCGASSAWLADGTATASLTPSWDAVTEDVDGAPLTVDTYRVLTRLSGDAASEIVAATVPGTAAVLKGFTPEVQYEVAVQCRSAAGSWSALTEWAPITAAMPSSGLSVPDAPSVVSLLGLIVATWNGLLGGLPPEYHFDHIRWETSLDGSTWAPMDDERRTAGDSTFRGFELGSEVQVRLVAVAVDGTESDPSAPVTVTVAGSDASAVIEAGTIVANLVQAGALTVNELAPSVGDELTMTAAGGVAIRISDMVNDQRQRYDFGPSGLVITEPGSLLSVTLSSSEIAMMQGSQKVSWWEAQILNVPQIAIEGGRVVNHTVSDDGAGGTVWMVA